MIHDKYSEFIHLCKAHKVDKVYAFGSSITDRFDLASSDTLPTPPTGAGLPV